MRLLQSLWPGLTVILLLCWGDVTLKAQDHDHSHDDHSHGHRNELGMANAPVYFINEKEFTYGLHLHYVRNIDHSRWGYGLGYERIFDDHEHQTWSLVAAYRPADKWVLIVAPGLTYEEGDIGESAFALHIEAGYEIQLGDFHIGPAMEIAYDPEDYHFSIGLHIGYGF